MSKYREIGEKVIAITEEKDTAYGHSLATAGDMLKLLYPDGIKPEQYRDAAVLVRIIDKLKRVATKKDAFGESSWLDIAGYGLAAEVAESAAEKVQEVVKIGIENADQGQLELLGRELRLREKRVKATDTAESTAVEPTGTKEAGQYYFPETIFVAQIDLKSQLKQLSSEFYEFINAFINAYEECEDSNVEELWDLVHSAETMLRMYQGIGWDVWAEKAAVEQKNRERGYYVEEVVHAETSPA